MRRLLYLTAFSMVVMLMLAPTALAQTGDLDCPQLSEAEKQAVYAADPSDPNGLDADDDGVPCEDDTTDDGSYEAPTPVAEDEDDDTAATAQYDQYAAEDQYAAQDQYAAPVPDTELPDTGGLSLLLVAGVLLVGSGILSAAILRRDS